MYITKFVILMCVVGVLRANDDFKLIDSIEQEEPCISRGGLCTIAVDCSPGLLVSERHGLCPKQQSKGIECCYGKSRKEKRCSKHGGMCIPTTEYCNHILLYKDATDCSKETKCCILV